MADPVFVLTSTNPFGLSKINRLANPTFADIDGDGDLDAFIGESDGYYSNTQFFKNISTTSNPIFDAPIINPFGLKDTFFFASPKFADIDGDGDHDAFIGASYGSINFFRNSGTFSNPIFTNPSSLGLVSIGGEYVIPAFVDIDNDGDLDAFIGTGQSRSGGDGGGDTLFYRNTGTAQGPAFSAIGKNLFGLHNVVAGASPTFVDIDDDGDSDAFIGNTFGDTQFFRNIGTPTTPIFANSELNPFGLIDVGNNATPTFSDIDGDGDLDAFLGNWEGDTKFFVNNGLLLASTSGNDTIQGTPSSNDTVSYIYATSPVTVSLNINLQQDTIGAGLDTITDFENLIGSIFEDNLNGNSANNLLEGRGGNDVLRGWSGADKMIGGPGNDTSFVENTGDLVIEKINEGIDTVSSAITYTLPSNVEKLILSGTGIINGTGNELANELTGNGAANQLNGQAGNDILNGGAGNDTLTGWSGVDTMIGGIGNDLYFVENVGDVVTEVQNQGIDTVSSRITYTLPSNVENLILTGTGNINGTGNNLANVITGNNLANIISGGTGNDVLDGGLGTNTLIGGLGNDFFRFTTKGHTDSITDYNVINDTIQLENAVFTSLTAGILMASQFRIGTKALDSNDFFIYNKTAGTLLYDSDGSNANVAIQIANLSTGLNLTNADIVVI